MGAESQTEYPPPKKERTQRTEKRQTEQEILRADWEKRRRRRRRSEQGGGVEKGASLSLQPGFSEVTVLTHRGWTGKITLRSSFFTP